MRRPGTAEQARSTPGAGHLGKVIEVIVDHRFDLGSVSALSEMSSKSACAFPMISNAIFVRCSSASSRTTCRRDRPNSTSPADRRSVRGRTARPARAPLSRCLRHSDKCDEYRPSRRKNAPRSGLPFGKASYASK